jgi:F-type H+-transporting ATPase subunit alpha
MDIPVGDALLGRVINPLGEALDDKGVVPFTTRLPIERSAPAMEGNDPAGL